MKLRQFFAFGHARMAGSHRVNENQIAVGEQGVFVVGQGIGRRRRHAHLVGHHAMRPGNAQVQPHAAGAGAAVEAEGDGAGFNFLHAFQCVGDEEKAGARFVGRTQAFFASFVFGAATQIIAQHHGAHSGGVVERFFAHHQAVLGTHQAVLQLWFDGQNRW